MQPNQGQAPPNQQPYAPPPPPRRGSGFGAVPTAFWVGLIIGGVAFAVKITSQQITSGSGGYSCSYLNFAGLLAAAAIGLCLVAGWAGRARSRWRARLTLPWMTVISILLVALGTVHALRGTGAIANPCDGHPLP